MIKFILSLLLCSSAMAQDVGLDLLGLQHPRFPVAQTVSLVPEGFVGGNLDWTFGTSLSSVERVLRTGRVKRWRVHLFNGPGLRNRQLGKYEPHFGYTTNSFSRAWERGDAKLQKHLAARVRLYCGLFARYPGVVLEISPTLEHNLTARAFREQARVVRRECPAAEVVENPVGGVPAARGFHLERHGVSAGVNPPCNSSMDGDTAEDVDLVSYLGKFSKCRTAYVWSRTLNGRLASGAFVDPRARKAFPDPQHLRALFRMLEPFPIDPLRPDCRAVLSPRLYKPFAEDKGIGDIRANKPLWLTPFRGDLVTIHDGANDRLIGGMAYYGPFDGGGLRYYSGTGSNLTPMELLDRAESVVIREGDRCYGPFPPLLRQGSFR